MGKIKKFTAINIKKLVGGKDPIRAVEEFLLKINADPDACKRERTGDHARWMVSVGEEVDLEILIENLKKTQETTVYLGVNILAIPIRGAFDVMGAALEIADGLVGLKVSLVGHFLVLSATLGAADISADDIEYHYKLITAQRGWFLDALTDELGLERVEEIE